MAWLWTFFLALSTAFASPEAPPAVDFGHGTLKLGGRTLKVEIARTEEQLERGLMFRKNLKDDEGMIFVFPRERTLAFWMKNTFIDLAIGYFDAERRLVDIQEMKATTLMTVDHPSYPSKAPAMYALEVPRGWFDRHKVKTGAVFTLDESPAGKKSSRKSGP